MITTNEVPAIPKKAINEITFLLYNYNDLEQIIRAKQRRRNRLCKNKWQGMVTKRTDRKSVV